VFPRSAVAGVGEVKSFEIYGFSDASYRAYGAVVYARVNSTRGRSLCT